MELRTIYKKKNKEWIKCRMSELISGDMFKIYQDNELIGKFIAFDNPFFHNDYYAIKVKEF